VRRGEIRWHRFAGPDKVRPVLILTRDSIIDYLGEVTVAPITSRIRDIPSEVRIGKADGMQRECTVNCDHMQTVAKGTLGTTVATLQKAKLAEVARAVRFALDM
jgi:mRNA interferase MazF